jgi:putative ABC transport system permease protein
MGRLLLVGRLAARDLRRRPAEGLLLLLAIMTATTTLTLGLVLRGMTDAPYESTREATAGPDVVASFARVTSPASQRISPACGHSPALAASSTTAGRTRWSRRSSRQTASLGRGVRPGAR